MIDSLNHTLSHILTPLLNGFQTVILNSQTDITNCPTYINEESPCDLIEFVEMPILQLIVH